jgi:signal transduction histidine kinase
LALLILATGGLASPFMLTLPPLAFIAALAGPPRFSRALVALESSVVWVLAAIHGLDHSGTFVPRAFAIPRSTLAVVAVAAILTVLLWWMRFMGSRVRATHQAIVERTQSAAQAALSDHEQHARMLTMLAAEIAHELKNPLASIKGLAGLITPALEGRHAERAAVMRTEIDRVESVLKGFLDFSRPLSPLAPARVQLDKLAKDVATLFEATAAERGITVSAESEGAVEAECDSSKVRQLLINLVKNAVHACAPAGAVIIRARGDSDRAVLSVEDDGPGIADDIASRLFEPGVSNRSDGAGIGLTIARSLAQQHGGDLTLTNRDGGGCLATFTWPLILHPAEASAQS